MNRTLIACGLSAGLILTGVRAARSGDESTLPPKPKATLGDPANDLPLALYKKLKKSLNALAGVFSPDGKMTKEEARAALKKDAAKAQVQLLKALHAAQVIHRELAARALAFSGNKEALIEALGPVLAAEPDADVRRAAASTLVSLEDAAAVETLIRALADQEAAVRAIAVTGLGKLKDDRAAQPLLDVLTRETKPAIRMKAAGALKRIRSKKTLQPLLAALDQEKDYRVKMAIASAVRAIRGRETPNTKGVPTTQQHGGQLTSLSKEMKEVEGKLRDDRHDQAVQVQQKEIEQQLAAMIKKLQQMQGRGKGKGKGRGKSRKNKPGQGGRKGGGRKSGSPSSPLADSTLSGSAAKGALREAQVSGVQDDWAKLPPAMRDEMMQIYRGSLPPRWRKRLQAYFYSVAGEAAKAGK